MSTLCFFLRALTDAGAFPKTAGLPPYANKSFRRIGRTNSMLYLNLKHQTIRVKDLKNFKKYFDEFDLDKDGVGTEPTSPLTCMP
eukprot:9483264-Pyramimonas_sp.AAC.1